MLVWQPILVARLAMSNLKKNTATFVFRSVNSEVLAGGGCPMVPLVRAPSPVTPVILCQWPLGNNHGITVEKKHWKSWGRPRKTMETTKHPTPYYFLAALTWLDSFAALGASALSSGRFVVANHIQVDNVTLLWHWKFVWYAPSYKQSGNQMYYKHVSYNCTILYLSIF